MTKKLATFIFRWQDPESNEVIYSSAESECCPKGDVSEGIKNAAKILQGCEADVTATHFNYAEVKCHGRHFEVFRVDCATKK
jgi:hypothetical protein